MAADPRTRDAELVPRILTFLIADIRGYTAFTQEHGDEAAARLAGVFAEIVREAVDASDGRLVELRGDEALAVFTSPRVALRTAVQLQQVLEEEVRLRPRIPLRVGIGLDAGEAVPIEGGYRGGALNLAARLCSRAGPGEVLASPELVHLARAVDGLRYEERTDLELKGLDGMARAFRVSTVRSRADAAADAPPVPVVPGEVPALLDLLTPIAGRESELRTLRWSWRLGRVGPPKIIGISGPSGSGKTRLVADLADLAAADGAAIRYLPCPATDGELVSWLTSPPEGHEPALTVIDDLDRASPTDLEGVVSRLDHFPMRSGALVVTFDPEERGPASIAAAFDRLVRDGSAVRLTVGPLDESAVELVARLYLDDPSVPVPSRAILQASDGLPARVHELAISWARAETTRRLGESVSRAAAGRSDLRRIENELAANVIDLQLARERSTLYGRDAEAAAATVARIPYKGLASFDSDDASSFFGRERLVADLVGRLAGTTFLGVVGPSGSGKSSVVRAGLLSAVASGVLPGSERWTQIVMRPGEDPLRELDRAVFAALPDALRARLPAAADPLAAAAALLPDRDRAFVVVDQFEEVFTSCPDIDERRRFIDAMVSAARSGAAAVIIIIRADFYGRCAEHAGLAELLAESHLLVGPMTAEEYRRVIEQPARRAGVRIEPALVEELLTDVAGEPGALPLLSTALLELWQRREGRTIRFSAYQATGGVRGAVARLAEEAFGKLSETERHVARAAMLRLSAGEGEHAVRRRVPLSEFDASTSPEVGRVIAVLTDARLLTVDDGYVEIAHEALIREWPRLRAWLEEDREGRRLRQHLTGAAREWETAGRDRAELYRGARLTSALDWTTEHTLELNELERQFIAESRTASERDAERQRRSNRRLRLLLVGVAILFVASLGAGAFAVTRQTEAERSAAFAEEQRSLADQQRTAAEQAALAADAQRVGAQALVAKDLDLSLLLARQGVELHDSLETRQNLLTALLRSPAALGVWRPLAGRLLRVQATPSGTRLLVESNQAGYALLDPSTGASIRTIPPEDGFLVLNDEARSVAIVDRSVPGTCPGDPGSLPLELKVLDTESGKELGGTTLPIDRRGFSWSADLKRIAIVSGDGLTIGIHDFETLEELDRMSAPAGKPAWDAWWHGDDRLLVQLHDGPLPACPAFPGDDPVTFAWWRIGDANPIGLSGPLDDVGGVFAVSPKLDTLALGHQDGSVTMIDLGNQQERSVRGRHNAGVTSVGFSPDGTTLVTTGDDNVAIGWDVASGELVETFAGHNGRVFGPAFARHEGRTAMYTVGLDGLLIGWDLTGEERLGRPFKPGTTFDAAATFDTKQGVAVSPDGRLVAVSSSDGMVKVLEVATLAATAELPAVRDGPALDVAFSPDGRQLAIAGVGDDLIRLWDTSTWQPVGASLPGPPAEVPAPNDGDSPDPAFAWSVAFSPDGRTVAASAAGRVWFWDTTTREPVGQPIEVPGGIFEIEFGRDSTVIAGARAPGNGVSAVATVWRVDTGQELYTVEIDSGYGFAGAVTFSPDGRILATGGGTGDIRLFDASTGTQRGSLVGAAGWVLSLAFAPSGDVLASGGSDGTVRLFDMRRLRQIGESLPAPPNGGLTVAFAAEDRLVVVYDSGSGAIWDTSPERWASHACAVARRSLTEEEWAQVLPGRPYDPACVGP